MYKRQINKLTGRDYKLFNYYGAPDAEEVIVVMCSASETVKETVDYLNAQGRKVGMVQIHLFRPFSVKHFAAAIPATCKRIAVLDRNKETGSVIDNEIYMGDLPLMTDSGTFVINGSERVVVSQLVCSPGVYYGFEHDKTGKKLFKATVIPNRGAWLEYEMDANDVFYVRVDRTRKVPITVLIRALGIGTNAEIKELFGEEPKILASIEKDPSDNYEDGLLELYKKIRPGEPLSVDSAEALISGMFFDPRRYDLAKVGRYKFNKKLALKNRISGQVLAEDVVDPSTGEVIAEAGTVVDRALATQIQNAAVPALSLIHI